MKPQAHGTQTQHTGRVMRHTGIFMVMELGIRLMDALVSVILARHLAPAGFGLLSFALSFAALFSLLPGFGMGALTIREVARQPAQISRHLITGLYAKVFLSGLMLLLMAGAGVVMGLPKLKFAAALIAGSYLATETALNFVLCFFQALQKPKVVAAVNLSVRAGWVAGSLLVLFLGGGVLQLLGIRYAISTFGLLGAILLVQWRLHGITSWKLDFPFLIRLLKDSFPFVLFRLRGQLYGDVNTVMISIMKGDTVTGWYASSQKLLRLFTFIPGSLAQALLPIMAKNAQDAKREISGLFTRVTKYLLMISLPIAAVGCVLAKEIILQFYGPQYAEAARTLQVLVWTVPFVFLNGALVPSIGAVEQERRGATIMVSGMILASCVNLVVVPLFGAVGAASTTLLSEIMMVMLLFRLVRKKLPGLSLTGQMGSILLAVAGMSACALALQGYGLAIAIVGALAAYAILIAALRLIEPEDVRVFQEVLRKRSGKQMKVAPIEGEEI